MMKGKNKATDKCIVHLQTLQEVRGEEMLVGCRQAKWLSWKKKSLERLNQSKIGLAKKRRKGFLEVGKEWQRAECEEPSETIAASEVN